MKIICGLLAICVAAWGQESSQKVVQKMITLRYVEANRIGNLVSTFRGLSARSDDRLHVLAVSGPADVVSELEEAVKKLDVAPLDFELTVYLIAATPQATDHLPEALASTAKQLHGVFAYKGYELLDSFVLRGRDGQGTTTGMGASADGTIKNSSYTFRYRRASVLEGAPRIVSLQELFLQVRTPNGKFDEHGNALNKTAGVSTDIDIRDGQKVVVGKSDVNNAESPLILVVTAKVVE